MLKRVLIAVFSLVVVGSMLTGCSANFAPGTVAPQETPLGEIHGNVHGGNFPVTGSQIYIFAAGQGGYGTSAKSLLNSANGNVSCSDPIVTGACYVTTDYSGNFSIGGEYTCTEGQQVYMVSVGGNPGMGSTSTTATFSKNSYSITVPSGTNVSVGATVSGTDISGTVTAVNGTTVTVSQPTTGKDTNESISISAYNPAIIQMAALGQCPAAGNMAALVPYLVINEVTTVAFAYSVGGFATNAFNVSSDVSGATALANAFANANNIVNIAYGQAPTAPLGNANAVNPQAKINAMANILVTCVNQSSSSSTGCTDLFKYATTASGTKPTDEATAIFNIVHNQGSNVTSLWNLTPATAVFQPTLTSAPSDWTMPVVYSSATSKYATDGNNITGGASNIAFDANGNAWIGDRVKGVVQISPTGTVATYNPGFSMVKGIAVSPDSTQIWVTDYTGGSGNGQLDLMSTSGSIKTSLSTDMNGPSAVAVDANGNAFVANDVDGSVIGVSSTGAFVATSGAVGVKSPESIAVDNNGNVWLPSSSSSQVIGQVPLTYSTSNSKFKGFGTTGTVSADYSYGVAVDSNNNIWIATNETFGSLPLNEDLDELTGTLSRNRNGVTNLLFSLTTTLSGSGFNGGGLGLARQVTVDGGNNIWMANSYYKTISEYSQTQGAWQGLTGFNAIFDGGGFSNASTGNTLAATPDPSGNLWTANEDGTVTQLLGLATPTASPIYPGVQGTMP